MMNLSDPDASQHETEQHVAYEIMAMMPRVRDNISVSVQTYAGETCYVIEDKISSKFYRLGLAEYTFVSLLDGDTTIAEAMGRTASVCGADALSERETGTLCKWLLDSGIATTSQSRSATRQTESRDKDSQKKVLGKANPIMQKLPLVNPMPLLRPIDGVSRQVFSWFGAVIWSVVVTYGAYQLWSHWDQFSQAGQGLLSSSNWVWLLASWVGLKLIHEMSHAMACRKYNGNVREAGLVFIVLAPMPYVDVTSIWKLDSKWKRILVSAAGMYAEIFVAAVAAIIWCNTFDPLVKQHCVNVIVTATLVTVLFNANPLMRFDGYYILSDAIEMPNLATHGRQWMAYFMRRYFMGVQVKCPQWPEGKHAIVVVYAILSFVWRILITVSIAITAEVLFHGAGVVLAVTSLLVGIAIPLYRSINTLTKTKQASYARMLLISGLGAACLWGAWSVVPWYSQARVPVVVDYHPAEEIRCGVSGFLVENAVRVGDRVKKGQVLAVLSNRELEIEADNLRLQIEQSLQRARDYRVDGAIAAVQVEWRNRHSLETRADQVRQQIVSLRVVAPSDGIIAESDIESRRGTVLKAGDRMFVMGTNDREMIYGLIDQRDIDAFRDRDGESIDIHVWGTGRESFQGTVRRVLPRASTDLKHAALGAHVGGPLTVQPKVQKGEQHGDQVELVQPRFPILIDFAGCESEAVLPGQSGYATLHYRSGTIGQIAVDAVRLWIRTKRQMMSETRQSAQAKCLQLNDHLFTNRLAR
ncbi:HlyD family efflux transporter periplasmic adaptor subunit [Planctomycetes bacterium K23_9]|uniref:Peptidase family M50 n=1 Tax=Stieleria marina TaxID=1930275 RepID=A0A517P132_9BACT|nr:Peptidase family M50 [Planctomycetes bacterium K23_9]